jgi:hypothetical protein
MMGFHPRLSFRIVDWIWENLTLLLTFLSHKIMSRQKKALKFCFYFVLFIYAHPNFPIWRFLFHSWQVSWVSSSLMLHASMNWWINQFQSILIRSNSIQSNLFPFNCIHFSPIHHNELDEIQFISFVSIHSNPMNLILFISFHLNLV